MKLIIDMPEEVLNTIKTFKGKFICENGYDLIQGIKNGTPLDSVKAEIEKPIQEECCYIGEAKIQADTIKWCLEILDNIGKVDMIGKNCNTCKNNDDEFSGECYECVKNIQNHYKSERGGEWISVTERLPKERQAVLCWAKSTAERLDAEFIGQYDNGVWFLQSDANHLSYPHQYNVVAWQPLPEPYKAEREVKPTNDCFLNQSLEDAIDCS